MDDSGLAAAPQPPAQEERPRAVRSRWWRRPTSTPGGVVVAYAALGALWVILSQAATGQVRDPAWREPLEVAEGLLLVGVTSLVLYALVRRWQARLVGFGIEIRAAIESMAEGLVVVDHSGIVEANRAALEILGAEHKADLLGGLEAFAERYQPRTVDGSPLQASQLTSSLALNGTRSSRDTLLRRLDGRDVVVSISASPIRSSGSPGLVIAVFRDVSDAHRLEAMRDEFLSTAAHELKTPLAVVKAYAQLVQRRVPAEAPALTVVQRQVDRMTRLVQHLLDTSRLRLDPESGPEQRFDLEALAVEALARLRAAEPEREIRQATPGPVLVRADRDRIARVIQSLLDNAVRFSPGGGPIELRVERREVEVHLSVSDRGLGIPADRQARIFERYYRAHAGTPEDYGGLGLSLEMSREIVGRHGGRMWFESEAGRGSTFHFSLPIAAEGSP